ncbi:MAG: glycosyltransferase [Muribaculaceae bacterium]
MSRRRLLQINTVASGASTATLMHIIDAEARRRGYVTAIAYGRGSAPEAAPEDTIYYRIGSAPSVALHVAATRIADAHGLMSSHSTRRLMAFIDRFDPDVVYLHNIHGYYLNYPILFDYLRRRGCKVVWHLHDCWPITGHCAFYQAAGCNRCHTAECRRCESRLSYPRSFFSRAHANYRRKKATFTGLSHLYIIAVSRYLADEVRHSFLGQYRIHTVVNGIDTAVFAPPTAETRRDRRCVLAVANVWTAEKGIFDLLELRRSLPADYDIVVAGRLPRGFALPEGITHAGIIRDSAELARLYGRAAVFVSLSRQEGCPLTTAEALACGTPVVAYDVCGVSADIPGEAGTFVAPGDIAGIAKSIMQYAEGDSRRVACRAAALTLFDSRRVARMCLDIVDEAAGSLHL